MTPQERITELEAQVSELQQSARTFRLLAENMRRDRDQMKAQRDELNLWRLAVPLHAIRTANDPNMEYDRVVPALNAIDAWLRSLDQQPQIK